MKFPLPGFPGRKQAGGKQDKPTPTARAVSAGGEAQVSLGRIRFQMLVAEVLLTALLALFIFQFMSFYITRAIEQDINKTTEQVAARVSTMVDLYNSSMAMLAKDPDIAVLLMVGTRTALQEREQSLGYSFPQAINLQLLPPGIEETNDEVSPPLGYAALAQMRAAETSEEAPLAEVHLFNTPQQHINIVRRVMDPAGTGVVGHIMLSLPGEILQKVLGGVQHMGGYVELQQTGSKGAPVAVASHGDPAYKNGGPAAVRTIEGSRWQVAYWPANSSLVFLGKLGVWVMVASILVAGAMVFLTLVLFKRIHMALRQDQISLVTLIKDYRDNQVGREYPSGLIEMQETLDFMTRIAGGHRSRETGPGVEREQDKDYGTATVEGDVPMNDFDTLNPDSLVLEEDPLDIKKMDTETTRVDASIFRAYDIRGVVNRTLTTETVRLIGRAIGSEAIQRGRQAVVVGRDGRLSGPALSEALIAGLTECGCEVKDIGCVPTPVLYFATHYLDTHTGVIVTGSHNPPEYNGLKIVIDGETLAGKAIQYLRERIDDANFISGQGSVEHINVVPDYIERIRADVTVARPLKVVVDCGNGVAGEVVPRLLREVGCEVTELFCEVDGNFPNHHPDPSKTENLEDLISIVRELQADVGLAFDGDGDRLGVVTTEGNVVWPDRALMLFAADVLERNPGGQIIYDVKCSRNLDSIIREHGGQPLMWKTGHSFIKAKMKETGALLAGEMSGHIFFKERWYGFDDGLYAAARLLEILGRDDRPASAVFNSLPDSVNTPELNVAMREGEPPAFIDRLLASAHFEGAETSTIDGLRADFEDGWGLVRASNTTPVLVLRFEADNEAAMAHIMGEFRRVMLQVEPGLSLPF